MSLARQISDRPSDGEKLFPLSLLIVDDSLVTRSIIQSLVERDGEISVVASVASVSQAVAFLEKEHVDVVLLDLEMPGQGGLEGLPLLIAASNNAPVLILSAVAQEHSQNAIDALALGAADTLCKPGRMHFGHQFAEELTSKIKGLVKDQEPVSGILPSAEAPDAAIELRDFGALAIGGSTGAIPVMLEILTELPRGFQFPVFVAQHLPEEFLPFFRGQMEQRTGKSVVLAAPGLTINDSAIYLMPHDNSLSITKRKGNRIFVRRTASFAFEYNPSVDLLFAEVAESYGRNALVLLLSGMGRDGESGARSVAETSGQVAVQSLESSVVWGMPGSVVRSGISPVILSPAQMLGVLLAKARK